MKGRYQPFAVAAFLSIACGVLYLALCPPLYDGDGYRYRLFALESQGFSDIDAHHLLWIPLQVLLATIAQAIGHPSTVIFQVAGILINCLVIFLFYLLLWRTGCGQLFAVSGTLFVAFSPQFWHLGSQNQPYPLLFLAFVMYLHAWQSGEGSPPSRFGLLWSGLWLCLAVLLHQATIVVVVAGVLAIIIGEKDLAKGFGRAVAWGAGIGFVILPVYLLLWAATTGEREGFFRWATAALDEVHPIQFQFPTSLIQTFMGIAGSLVQSNQIQGFFEQHVSAKTVLALYGALGVGSCLGMVVLIRRTGAAQQIAELIQNNSLFATSLLSVTLWSAVLIAWEPVTSYYWVLDFFPALTCLGLLFRERAKAGLPLFAAILFIPTVWNGIFNVQFERFSSRNFPDPLVASVRRHLQNNDIFVALGREDWYGQMNYELLFDCLKRLPRNPGVTILNDYVLPAQGSALWRNQLRDKIDATLKSGGRVFVAAHVLNQETYEDLAGTNDPYNAFLLPAYEKLDGPALYKEIVQVLAPYKLSKAHFAIGLDPYFELRREVSNSARSVGRASASADLVAASQSLGLMTVAITVDDLPVHGDLTPGVTRTQIAQRLLSAFKASDVNGVYGFSNGADINSRDNKLVYEAWLGAGQPLGNHTYDHLDLKASTVSQFIASVRKMDKTLQTLARDSPLVNQRRVFRYPYLSEGETLAKRDAVRRYLADQGYRIAEVSFTYDDWAWNEAYVRCVSQRDANAVAWLKDHVVDDSERRLRSADAIARLLFGRGIKQILLIHIGAFDAVMLDTILKDWKAKGVHFTTFDDAASDPVYSINPNYAYYGELTFLEQMVNKGGLDITALDDNTYTVDELEQLCHPGGRK